MKHHVINVEETIGKTVGRRVMKDGWRYAMGMQKLAVQLQKTVGTPRFPRGVYRFNSFEEADAWTMKYLTAKRPN
ncbi:MAG: hypothetical protein ACR2NX_13990 [Chthoniobacterales bacterium]